MADVSLDAQGAIQSAVQGGVLHRLPRVGRLWSWTVQRFRPKSPPYAGPEVFEPYAVGYVQLGDTIIVEGRLTGISFDALRIDLPMRLVTESFDLATGENRMTYAFTSESDR